ncbi:hypothetical protein FOXG_18881 [Fusarium oxysporum f. sp. lycopersici 4287]|uniref:Uncharacterized protein n=2 Tax=Fusarium oxysporum TaxID=5507 RepID=A0A0J9UPI8_FUSO4|nr:hypothetical protein FOXG_18881 [Fusarium oxysporum f. sp. lycopersici 4287]EXK43448.1 hypothetical protein FOMG_02404 [Fusarium oxysporum f. sp. melonis 26406]KNB01439.1 hypothetical protein FOXG_18881 [Fusarium oxysporum f. sp. lycopersici 4287]
MISKDSEVQESKIASLNVRITSLEEEVGRLKGAEALAAGEIISMSIRVTWYMHSRRP